MSDFDDFFLEILNGREQTKQVLNEIIEKQTTDKFQFEVVNYTTTNFDEDSEDADKPCLDIPGYQVYLMAEKSNHPDYKYLLFDISLPEKGEVPISFTFKDLNKSNNYSFNNFESFKLELESKFKTREYNSILNRMSQLLY